MQRPTYDDIKKAHERIKDYVIPTPLLTNTMLDKELNQRIFLKLESLQATGSFKWRGAVNRLLAIKKDKKDTQNLPHIVACSSGNHGQAIAYASSLLGFYATIVMPKDAPAIKIDKTRIHGAEIVLYDRFTQIREDIAMEICHKKKGVFVHPFDDPYVIAGQGTVGLDIVHDMQKRQEDVECVIIPASGGGLASGICIAIKHHYPHADIYVVEPLGYESMGESLRQGVRKTLKPTHMSICDALMAKTPGELTYAINARYLTKAIGVSDDKVKNAVKRAFYDLKLVIEPGGAIGLACVLSQKISKVYKNTVVIISGGNIDKALLSSILNA